MVVRNLEKVEHLPFNPTVVRLRPPFSFVRPTAFVSFNPTVVRLRLYQLHFSS